LEIKKTLQPNHAKLYIFENQKEFNQGGDFLGTVITGSSNLSRSGPRGRFEINVVSRDSINFSEAYNMEGCIDCRIIRTFFQQDLLSCRPIKQK